MWLCVFVCVDGTGFIYLLLFANEKNKLNFETGERSVLFSHIWIVFIKNSSMFVWGEKKVCESIEERRKWQIHHVTRMYIVCQLSGTQMCAYALISFSRTNIDEQLLFFVLIILRAQIKVILGWNMFLFDA